MHGRLEVDLVCFVSFFLVYIELELSQVVVLFECER